MVAAESSPRVAAELSALIRVNPGPATTHSHEHGVEHEFAMNGGLGRPADDLAREQVHDDG
jgi:hypothetical protein